MINGLNFDSELPENYIDSDMKSSIIGPMISAIHVTN
jgi:hypothetical protein